MYAPQYFTPQPAMIPGYMPQVPVFHTPTQEQKRDLSPLIVNSEEQDEKRVQNNSAGVSSIAFQPNDLDRELSLRDVMLEFKKLATKEDLVQVKSILVAQLTEIQQLKTELITHHECIKVLEEQAGARAVDEANRINQKPDVFPRNRKEHGCAQVNGDPNQNRQRNIVIHVLKAVEVDDIKEVILDMCQAVGCVIFASDIVDVTRLGVYEKPTAKPPWLRVMFEYSYQRNNLLRRKSKLAEKAKFSEIYISPDEHIEQRRMRGIFRRITTRACAS